MPKNDTVFICSATKFPSSAFCFRAAMLASVEILSHTLNMQQHSLKIGREGGKSRICVKQRDSSSYMIRKRLPQSIKDSHYNWSFDEV